MNKHSKIAALFQKVLRGDESAFAEVYKLYANKLFRYGSVICPDKGWVEDTIQDLFLKILNQPEKFQHIVNYEVYLFKSIKINLQNKLQKTERRSAIIQHIHKTKINTEESIEEQLIQEEIRQANIQFFTQKLDKLPPSQKEVLYLRYYEGLSYEQIAKILSVSNQVARNYVSRALSRIRMLSSSREAFGF